MNPNHGLFSQTDGIKTPPQPLQPPPADVQLAPKHKPAPIRLIASAAVFGAVFALLFVRQTPGLNMTLFVLAVYAFGWYNRDLFVVKRFRDDPVIYLMTLAVLALGVLLFTGASGLNPLAVMVIVLIIFVQYLVLSGTALHDWDRPAFIIDMFLGGFNRMLCAVGQFSRGVFGRRCMKEKRRGVAIGIALGAILLCIVLPLLAMADDQMERIVDDFFGRFFSVDILLYLIAFYAAATLAVGPVAVAKREEYTGSRTAKVSRGIRPVLPASAAIALTMVCAVYVLFAALQMRYFFNPEETINQTVNLTRSYYAVRGFGEMVFISCLNFVLVALTLRFVKNDKPGAYQKVLLTLLIAFNFVIMASSHMRMAYYEAAFGYTVARMLSHSFMVLLAALGVMMLVRIYVPFKIFKLAAALIVLYFCTVVTLNPERFITQRNIARYETAGEIDAVYSLRLGGDATADMCAFLQQHPELLSSDVRQTAEDRLSAYDSISQSWQSLNVADARAADSLGQIVK